MLENSKRSAKGRWFFLIKLAITVSILTYLLSRIDLGSSGSAIRQSLGFWLFAAFLTTSLLLITSTYKWDVLLRALGIYMSWWQLVKLYTIGFFASSFLPGGVGGDVVRWHLAGQQSGMYLEVGASILVERITGVIALVAVCLLAVTIIVPEFAAPPVLLLLGGVFLALIGGLTLALNRWLATVVMFRVRHLRIRQIVQPLYKLHRALRTFPKKPLFIALGWSLLFYLSGGLAFFIICKAFTAQVTLLEATAEQWLISLLTLIPISVGGLGLAQAGDVYLLGILGVSAAQAFGISIMRQLIGYCYVLIGGYLFIFRERSSSLPGHAGPANQ